MKSKKILTKLEDAVFTITLNHPEKMNCMGMEMLKSLHEAIKEAEEDNRIKVVCIRGAGERAFSSGADLKEFAALNDENLPEWIRLGNHVFHAIENLPKPTFALIQGYTYGGGLELAVACDFRLVEEGARFSNPELGHGWLPGWGGIRRLKKLVGEAKVKELLFLSSVISETQALKWGLITAIAQKGALNNLAKEYIDKILPKNTLMLAMAKNQLNSVHESTDTSAIDFDVLSAYYARQQKSEKK
ncbi:MAG: enoyl-CoA hydratase/isomerase family protein [Bacteroidota bacterium]